MISASRANGPGLRAVIWFQGCTLGCRGCFNHDTHDLGGGYLTDTALLADELLARRSRVEGVTISGGEPFQQAEALLDLLRRLDGSGLSSLVFSGYSRRELQLHPLGQAILGCVDVLIAGRYVAARHLGRGLLGSANQRIYLLTPRYTRHDCDSIPTSELILHADGTLTVSGVQPRIPLAARAALPPAERPPGRSALRRCGLPVTAVFTNMWLRSIEQALRAARPPAEGPPGRSALRRCGLPVTAVFTNMWLRSIEQAPSGTHPKQDRDACQKNRCTSANRMP